MKQHYFVSQTEIMSHFLTRTLRCTWLKKVMDDFHVACKAKYPLALLFQKLRNGRNSVRATERMADGRPVTAIVTEQRGLGAMQLGNDARLSPRRQPHTPANRPPDLLPA